MPYAWVTHVSRQESSHGNVCLFYNGKGCEFWTIEAVQKHITTKVIANYIQHGEGPLGPRSGHSHFARDRLRPGLDWDRITYISYMLIFFF